MNKQIPVLTSVEYLNRGAVVCPVCKSNHITSEAVDMDGSRGYANCQCNTCGAHWTDIWKITGFGNLNEGMSKTELAECEKKATKFLVDTFGKIK